MADIVDEALEIINAPKTKSIFKAQFRVKNFDKPVTIAEAIKESGANYTVEKRPLYYDVNGIKHDVTTHCVTAVKGYNEYIGIVGQNYGIVQNDKAFEFINILTSGSITGIDKPVIETVGILNNGARMFVTAKIPSKFNIDGDDSNGIDDYICFTNSHDGSTGVMAYFTPIRVVCQNTLNASIRRAVNKLTFKHTSRVNERLDLSNQDNMSIALNVLKFHDKFKKEFINDLMSLKQIKISSDTDIDKLCAMIFADEKELDALKKNNYKTDGIDNKDVSKRKTNMIDNLRQSIDNGIGQSNNRGTGLWLYNGVTTYMNNYASFKDEEAKFNSIMSGDAYKKVQKAHDLILEMV